MISPRRAALRVCLTAAATVASTVSVPVWAKDPAAFGQSLELPAHRALIARRSLPSTRLTAFESDGCSGGMSEVWRLVVDQFPSFGEAYESAPPWESCCVTHDRAYHDGVRARDAETSFAARLAADRTLESCVINTAITRRDELAETYGISAAQVETAYTTIAGAMFWAVRFGGGPCTGLSWRWGFGYPDCSLLGGGGAGEVAPVTD